jgi:hypothetical protein
MEDLKDETFKELEEWIACTEGVRRAGNEETLEALLKRTSVAGLFQLAARFGFAHYYAERNQPKQALNWEYLLLAAGRELDRRWTALEARQRDDERRRKLAAPVLGE